MIFEVVNGKYIGECIFNCEQFKQLFPVESAAAVADIGQFHFMFDIINGDLYAHVFHNTYKFDVASRRWFKCDRPSNASADTTTHVFCELQGSESLSSG